MWILGLIICSVIIFLEPVKFSWENILICLGASTMTTLIIYASLYMQEDIANAER